MLPPPQDVHILISGTSEYVPLPGKRLCRHDEGSGSGEVILGDQSGLDVILRDRDKRSERREDGGRGRSTL